MNHEICRHLYGDGLMRELEDESAGVQPDPGCIDVKFFWAFSMHAGTGVEFNPNPDAAELRAAAARLANCGTESREKSVTSYCQCCKRIRGMLPQ